MIRIRLKRGGAKKAPFYHIVVTDSRKSRDGRFIERIGFFNPIEFSKNKIMHIDFNRIKYWKNQGAQLSKRIFFLIKKQNF